VLPARILKVLMIAALALFGLVVTYDNIVDYRSNYEFVRHVLSMDTTFPGNALIGRAITDPALWHAAYNAIILAEGLMGLAFAIATADLARALFRDAEQFNAGKRFVFVGAGIGFLVWFLGFMVVGGEWFAMWQSKTWNGQQAAFRFYLTLIGVLVFVNQPDGELRWRGRNTRTPTSADGHPSS